MAVGEPVEEILAEYPYLEAEYAEDVHQALRYGDTSGGPV